MFDCGSLPLGEVTPPLVNSYGVGVVPAEGKGWMFVNPVFDHVGSDTASTTEHTWSWAKF